MSTNNSINTQLITLDGPLSITGGFLNFILTADSTLTLPTSGTLISTTTMFNWNDVVGTSQAMIYNNGYISSNPGLTTFTLPASSPIGKIIAIQGAGSGGWSISQNIGQIIHIGAGQTTSGIFGSLSSENQYDSIQLICIVQDLEWASIGGPQTIGFDTV